MALIAFSCASFPVEHFAGDPPAGLDVYDTTERIVSKFPDEIVLGKGFQKPHRSSIDVLEIRKYVDRVAGEFHKEA